MERERERCFKYFGGPRNITRNNITRSSAVVDMMQAKVRIANQQAAQQQQQTAA